MAVFPLLADPSHYRACETDLLADAEARRHWLDMFALQFDVHLEAAEALGVPADVREGARRRFLRQLDELRVQPGSHGRLDILLLDELRDATLHAAGIHDGFRLIKERENRSALAHLPAHLAAIDAIAQAERLPFLVRCLLAGNLFDMGAQATALEFSAGPIPFPSVIERVPARPWLIDDLDEAHARWRAKPPGRAVVFADNAGADVVLGALPLAREMLRRGAVVVLAANSEPSLNDVTASELETLRVRAAEIDPAFGGGRLHIVPSGNAAPLIDLREVSAELAEASSGADLVVLLGMGRALESNRRARFTCAAWKIAMIKDTQVARDLGGRLFDAVFRYERALPSAP